LSDVGTACSLALTGHPLQRAGAWAVVAMAGRRAAEEVTDSDLDRVSTRVVRDVCTAATATKDDAVYDWWKVLFALYPNSKPTHAKRTRDRSQLEAEVAEWFVADGQNDGQPWPCSFCGGLTGTVWTKSQLPMFDTNKALNTLPPGLRGWPVCRGCRIAAWVLPYGAWVTAGSATVLSCEREEVEREFAFSNVRRSEWLLQVGFGGKGEPAGARPERVVLAALRTLAGELPAAATLWTFKNDNQEPWLRVTRARRATPRFLARIDANAPLRRGWGLLVGAMTQRDKQGKPLNDGRAEAARLLFEAGDGRSRPFLGQLSRLLLSSDHSWRAQNRDALTRISFDYAKEVLGMDVDAYKLSPVASLLADWIEHGSGNPRGRVAEYRSVALSGYKLGVLLTAAHFRLALDGRKVTAGPEDWAPLIQQRPRAWEQRMLLAASVLQLLQQRGVAISKKQGTDEEAEERAEELIERPIITAYEEEESM
jgi:CRISPR-associated protein Cst1